MEDRCFGGGDGLEAMRRTRDEVKTAAGDRFVDDGYKLLSLNCYTFCYALLAHIGLEKPEGFIEAFNDEAHGVSPGTTYNCLHPRTALASFLRHCGRFASAAWRVVSPRIPSC